ncbi:LuxR C-terminal-related transcriptional regulator [Leucobacter triazinivorans]|uniref:Helix-turn-helix transcriptional regulator n=1 Tax=Leucobacter triazinivorans TaxID=1784719 RepID=A0A4P6KFG3_9MICO|nr:LuxR C-terminal-related transcriptional regulator [Leucobacter triazinivorans]QBE49215.1 helix-turn-helix transcriptional regulator [Leucobacter triazinivorans]
MFVGRTQSLNAAAELVRANLSVDVVGSRGSGKTTFLEHLRHELVESDWQVVSIRGVASLRQHPLAALHLEEIGQAGPGALQATATALHDRVVRPRSVILLDDWDDLDEATWGVVESVRRSLGVPVVLSRLEGLHARQTPSGLPASTIGPTYVIEMTPLRIDEIERALEDYLEGPIESSTLMRVFAKAGGNIGLTMGIVIAALRERRITRSNGGSWISSGELWSPSLRAVLESQLEDLGSEARDAIEIIALVGSADIESVRRLVDWETLELLERRGLVALLPSSPSVLVTVVPPLLVEYFRHERFTARRIRLRELIVQQLGSAESAFAVLSERETRPTGLTNDAALFAGLAKERARTRRLVTAAEWEAHANPASATRYVEALLQSLSPAVEETVEHVFATTDDALGDNEQRCAYFVLQAEWRAYARGDVEGALEILRVARPTLGQFERAMDAAEVTVLTSVGAIPDDFPEKLEMEGGIPTKVRLALLEAQMLVLVCTARFTEALAVFDALSNEADALDPGVENFQPSVLRGFALLGLGRHAEALDLLTRGFEDAKSYLNVEAYRAFGAAIALCHTHSGSSIEMDDLFERVFTTGAPAPFPHGAQIALFAIASMTACRRGQISAAERYVADARRYGLTDGPLPGQSLAWPTAWLMLNGGDRERAADELWRASLAQWERGATFAAILGLLAAVEINPDPERLSRVTGYLEGMPEAVVMQAQGAYVAALVHHDPAGMLLAAERLSHYGRYALAVTACQYAAEWCEAAEDTEGLHAARALEQVIRARVDQIPLDTSRFIAPSAVLSEREREVARFAARGLTNQEIAAQLVISVRTVENHMHKAMRKLGASTRHALGAMLLDT